MSLRMMLLAAFDDAEFLSIDGVGVENYKFEGDGVLVELADESDMRFKEQQIEIGSDGIASAITVRGSTVECTFSSKVPFGRATSRVFAKEQASSPCLMKVSIDGGDVFLPAPDGVRVIYDGVAIPGEDGMGQAHVNLTGEGLILDVWTTREAPLDHNIATSSRTIEEVVSEMVEADA